MDILSLPSCASPDSVFNTGIPLCDLIRGRIKGIIYVDKGVTFTSADCASLATFVAKVKEKTTNARGSRAYPIWDLLNFEDNTGDPATGSIGNLSTATIVTNEAVPAFQFGYSGGELRNKRMAAMIGGSYDVFFVDEQYAVYGYKDANGNLAGFSVLQNYVYAPKFTVSDAVNKYHFRVTLSDILQYRDLASFVVANSTLLGAVGLINVTQTVINSATNVHKVTAIADGGTSLRALYGSSVITAGFTAKNVATGASFTITGVTQDSATDSFAVTLDSTAWTALAAGDKVQINFPTPASLATNGVKPFEGIPVIVTKP